MEQEDEIARFEASYDAPEIIESPESPPRDQEDLCAT